MKVRNGFVSNSSSSSFVVMLPKGFTLSDKLIEKKIKKYSEYCETTFDISVEDIKKAFNKLKRNRDYSEGHNVMQILMQVLEDFEITGEDIEQCCTIKLVNKKKIKEILK